MSKLYILDTNMLVHLVRGSEVWARVRSAYQPLLTDPRPLVSVVSIGELRSLAIQFRWQQSKLDQMEFCLGYFRKVTIDDPDVLRAYSVIDAHLCSSGQPLGKNDVWIAATAATNRATLLTTDRDFDRLTPQFIDREWIDPNT